MPCSRTYPADGGAAHQGDKLRTDGLDASMRIDDAGGVDVRDHSQHGIVSTGCTATNKRTRQESFD